MPERARSRPQTAPAGPADVTLRISEMTLELGTAANGEDAGIQRPGARPATARQGRTAPDRRRVERYRGRGVRPLARALRTLRRRWCPRGGHSAGTAARRSAALRLHANAGRHTLVSQPRHGGPPARPNNIHRPVWTARRRVWSRAGRLRSRCADRAARMGCAADSRRPVGRRVSLPVDQRPHAWCRRARSRPSWPAGAVSNPERQRHADPSACAPRTSLSRQRPRRLSSAEPEVGAYRAKSHPASAWTPSSPWTGRASGSSAK